MKLYLSIWMLNMDLHGERKLEKMHFGNKPMVPYRKIAMQYWTYYGVYIP